MHKISELTRRLYARRRALLLAFLFALAQATTAGAQTPTTAQSPSPTATPTPTPTPTPATEPAASRVTDAYRDGEEFRRNANGEPIEGGQWCAEQTNRGNAWCRERRTAGLNEIIYLKVAGLRDLLNRAQCKDKDGKPLDATCRPQNILLHLNGRPIKGLFPESGAPEIAPDNNTGTLRYHLKRYEGDSEEEAKESDEHWADLLGLDLTEWPSLTRGGVSVSIGLESEYPVQTDVRDFHLRRMRGWFLMGWLILAVLLGWALYKLARKSDLLRDRKPVLWGQRKPYSLSATQAAWWFVIVIGAFVFIWLVTGQYDLSTSVLVLLGIGFGTALGATVIDQSKQNAGADDNASPPGGGASDLDALLVQKEGLEAELSKLNAQRRAATDAAARAALDAQFNQKWGEYDGLVRTIKQQFPSAIGSPNQRFYLDILSDSSGVNFHRFQMAVWTIVLGIVFVYTVLSRLAMPKFSETLLTLMGISAGTYLGFKIPEKDTTADAQGAGAGNAPPPGGGGGVAGG